MNRGYYDGLQGKINSGLFLRRGKLPRSMNFNDMPHNGVMLGGFSSGGASPATLTTAYSFGVSGSVHAIRYLALNDCVLTDLYYATGANTGTPTGALTIEVRNSTATNNLPGTLITSQSHTPTASSWNRATFATPVTMTANTLYYIIIGDAAGNATNYYRVWQNNGGYVGGLGGSENRWWGYITTTNGFSTAGTIIAAGTVGVLRFSDGTLRGMINGGGGTLASNTLKRGIYVNELECDFAVRGVTVGSAGNWSGVEIFDASQGPQSTPLIRVECTADSRNAPLVYFPKPFVLKSGKNYRIVCTFSANTTAPGVQNLAVTTLPAEWGNFFEGLQGGRVQPTIETAGGGWSTGVRACGISHYSMIVIGNRIIDPRIL